MVKMLLDYGASPQRVDHFGNTPIHLATLLGDAEIVEVLLEHGAEIDATTESRRWTPLMIALNEKNLDLARWLMRQGANPNFEVHTEGWTPLLVACDMGLRDFSLQLIERGASLDAKVTSGDLRGRSAIHLASYNGEVGLVEMLVNRGADVNLVPDGGGLSSLHWAVYNGHQDLVEYLLSQGANPNLRADGIYQRRTPLHYAVSFRHLLIAEHLLQHHASPLVKDSEGDSPFDLAYRASQESEAYIYHDMVGLLKSYL